jgi:hypothetical protein
MPADTKPPARASLLRAYVAGGLATARLGALVGLALSLPAGCASCFLLPYGGGLVLGPLAALAGPVAGAWLAFHLGGARGLYRAGSRWLVLVAPVVIAATVLGPYALYEDAQSKDADYRRLVDEVQQQDPAPFLAHLSVTRERAIVEDHLEQFLVCASPSRVEVVDALIALDPHGKDGYALCAAAQRGQPATVSHLLARGHLPTHAHRIDGAPCQPLVELQEGSTFTAPCGGRGFEEFAATPTADGCKHRAEVAALLIEAGASEGDAGISIKGCDRDAGLAAVPEAARAE